ncbi:hypothetical protein AB0B15_16980 [Streptomyces sp. NPDC045456]|uniref:hypothetical protein n=1 Tax=Streptomyces sp. NPDC045456 TaxID=3155254 RepID=UPI0033C6F089
MTAQPAPFCLRIELDQGAEAVFTGDTPATVGPNVAAFAHAASRYAGIVSEARAAFHVGQLGATVIATPNTQ